MVQFLADKGAKIKIWNRKNKYGWTPLLIAEGHRPGNFKPSFEIVSFLRKLGPEVFSKIAFTGEPAHRGAGRG